MELVNGQHTVHFFDQTFLNCVHLEVPTKSLKVESHRKWATRFLPGYVLELFAVKSVHFLSAMATRSSTLESPRQSIMPDPYRSGIPTPSAKQSGMSMKSVNMVGKLAVFMRRKSTRALIMTITLPSASLSTWRKAPCIFMWAELWLWPCPWDFFGASGWWKIIPMWVWFLEGGGRTYFIITSATNTYESFSLSSVLAKWASLLFDRVMPPCEWPCPPCSIHWKWVKNSISIFTRTQFECEIFSHRIIVQVQWDWLAAPGSQPPITISVREFVLFQWI